MRIVGLTGSIGMGKSTVAHILMTRGIPVHDADRAVHNLYHGRAAPSIEQLFPGTVHGNKVVRELLGDKVFGSAENMHKLENIIHPLVREEEQHFLNTCRKSGHPVVILDIPLLFETNSHKRCDTVIVVSAPPDIQRARVLQRPNINEEKFAHILSRQLPDFEKRRRAHWIIPTSEYAETMRALDDLLRVLY
jgi:dephospho-CoA kinase